jgi:tRNA-dihydrouridine synthase B
VHCTRRHLAGYLKGLPGAAALRQRLNLCDSLDGCLEILDSAGAANREPVALAISAVLS